MRAVVRLALRNAPRSLLRRGPATDETGNALRYFQPTMIHAWGMAGAHRPFGVPLPTATPPRAVPSRKG